MANEKPGAWLRSEAALEATKAAIKAAHQVCDRGDREHSGDSIQHLRDIVLTKQADFVLVPRGYLEELLAQFDQCKRESKK